MLLLNRLCISPDIIEIVLRALSTRTVRTAVKLATFGAKVMYL